MQDTGYGRNSKHLINWNKTKPMENQKGDRADDLTKKNLKPDTSADWGKLTDIKTAVNHDKPDTRVTEGQLKKKMNMTKNQTKVHDT